MAGANRFSAIELDDDGNIVKQKAQPKVAAAADAAPQQQQNNKQNNNNNNNNNNNAQVQPAQNAGQGQNEHSRNRVSDRNKREYRGGRGGGGGEGGSRGGGRGGSRGGAHRGGYIGDGEKREFDRRGAPSDRPRGRARKGGVGLGRYDDAENTKRNRHVSQEVDPTVEPSEASADAAAVPADGAEATPATDAAAAETPAAVEEVAEPVPEEEPDNSLTYDEYQASLKAKQVDADVSRNLRAVEINDKQWKKTAGVLTGAKKKTKLNAKGEEVEIEEEERPVVEKIEKKKKILSLDEFVGTTPAPAQSSESSYSRGGGRGGGRGGRTDGGEFSGEFRGGRGGGGRGRGGQSGEFRGRGRGRGGPSGGRGGFRGPQVAIDDKNAFPDLSSAAKKN